MPSEGLLRALESLRTDDQVTADDVREILSDLRSSKRITGITRPRVKYADSKLLAYRRRIQELEDLWMSAERRAVAATFRLDRIRAKIAGELKNVERTPQQLLELIEVIEKEADISRLESERAGRTNIQELAQMQQDLEMCIQMAQSHIRRKK